MGWEDHLPGGVPLTTVEKLAGYARAHSVWPAAFGLACCAMELMATAGAQQPTRRPFIGSESQPTRHEHHISRQESS